MYIQESSQVIAYCQHTIILKSVTNQFHCQCRYVFAKLNLSLLDMKGETRTFTLLAVIMKSGL